jgi:hypothetical protein
MELLACIHCADRFYVPGVGFSDTSCCPHCGGSLSLALHDIASIPLDARSLNSDPSSAAEAPRVAA